MKINEVEKILDLPKATIRFYEKEGLLNPQRNANSYREYSNEDIELLKKIIVLRKIGVSVEDIKLMLNDEISLHDILNKNLNSLQNEVKKLEGAIKLCSLIHKKEEDFTSFDEEYYWNIIHEEEQKGNKFVDIINDVIEFERKVVAEEFGLIDEEGKMKYTPKQSLCIAFIMCLSCGFLWYLLDGLKLSGFIEGFFFPMICIIISSVFGLPVHFLEKKNKKAATIIKKIGIGLSVIFLIIIFLCILFLEV